MNYASQWQQSLQYIREKVSPHVYDVWFADIALESYNPDKNTVLLSVPHRYVYEYIEEQHVELMNQALASSFPAGVQLGYRIKKETAPQPALEYPMLPQIPQFSVLEARERMENGLKYYLGERAQWLPDYDKIVDWLSNNKGRGLLCIGTSGLGKTLVCEKILPIILGRKIKTVTAKEMTTQIDSLLQERCIIIDDLGKEPVEVKNYGNVRRPFFELCDAAERKGILLIITTNLSPTPVAEVHRSIYPLSIQERYGSEVLSRLHAITHAISLSGADMRH